MNELNLTITFTTYPTNAQLEKAQDFVKGYQLSNPNAKVTIITPRSIRP